MRDFGEKLFSGPQGKIFIFGVFLIASLIAFILVSYIIDTKFANKIIGLVVSHLVFGRVPSLSFGYAAELSHFVVIFTNFIMEVILVSIIYPLFVLSFHGMVKIESLENFFNRAQDYKEKHQTQFKRYGALGLFVFVFIPFWMTGPIVGAIIGFLIGISHFKNMVIVFIATAIAITLWGLFLQELTSFLMVQDSTILWMVLIFIVVLYLLYRFFRKPSNP